MEAVLWLTVAIPLVGAIATRLAGRRSGLVGAVSGIAAAIPAWTLLVAGAADETASSAFTWLPAGEGLTVGLQLDGLSAAMTATVGAVGAAILVYSAGYFAEDARARSAQAGLLAFLAAMQGLVLADGYLTLLIFWEIVGALSARLIAFSRDDPAAPTSAVRAFLTTRAADTGFYLAVLALFAATGSLAFGAERPDGALGALVGVGLVLAAMGKSAQAPLQTWLSGAMAGPTPVSALLHSATMVAAGVYLLMRSHDLLAGWPLEFAGWVGALTAVAGAAIALAQDDLKRVLAGSTTSQLGLMFVGVAAGGPIVALFHLIAHAAGKAGLFLSTGVFQHARSSTSLSRLRGAGRDDRVSFGIFALSALSIAAVPPLAAFWSKDAIVTASEVNAAWFVLVLMASAGAAAYLLRPALVLWRGGAETAARAETGRRPMIAAGVALTAATVALGLAGEPLAELVGGELPKPEPVVLALTLAAIVGGAAAIVLRVRINTRLATAAARQFHAQDVLDGAIVRPALVAADVSATVDDRVIDAAVDGVGRGTVTFARLQRRLEDRALDPAVDGLAAGVARAGSSTSRLQSGRLYEYLRNTVVGIVALALIVTLAALL
jgi:NADH-quinone oxidoreductase subunit L